MGKGLLTLNEKALTTFVKMEKMLQSIIFFFPTLCYLQINSPKRQNLSTSSNWKHLQMTSMADGGHVDRGETIVGNGENAGYQHFLLFPQCFKLHWPKASELLSWRCVCRASVNSSFKKLLRNYWLDFYQTSQECSLGGPLSNSFK